MSAKTDIVIVEDDVWLSEQLGRTLTKAGYSVKGATNGHEAIELIDELMPRAIILDMLLAGGTAIALLHELQSYQDTGGIPVILCTNLASSLSLEEMAPYGVRRILDKTTMYPDDIATAVRSVLL